MYIFISRIVLRVPTKQFIGVNGYVFVERPRLYFKFNPTLTVVTPPRGQCDVRQLIAYGAANVLPWSDPIKSKKLQLL